MREGEREGRTTEHREGEVMEGGREVEREGRGRERRDRGSEEREGRERQSEFHMYDCVQRHTRTVT